MKLTLVFLAALAVVAISRPQSEIPENMSMIDGLTKYSPPIISNAINSFSQKGKDALTKIDEASEEFRKAGKTFCADKFAAMLKELSPEDYQKLVDAGKELESEVRKLSQPIQDLFKKGKAMWTTGNAATAEELKEITEAVKNLTPDDQEAYFKLMPVAKKFLETVSA